MKWQYKEVEYRHASVALATRNNTYRLTCVDRRLIDVIGNLPELILHPVLYRVNFQFTQTTTEPWNDSYNGMTRLSSYYQLFHRDYYVTAPTGRRNVSSIIKFRFCFRLLTSVVVQLINFSKGIRMGWRGCLSPTLLFGVVCFASLCLRQCMLAKEYTL